MSNFVPGDVIYFTQAVQPNVPVNSLGVIVASFGKHTYTVYVASYNEPNRDIERFFAAIEGIVEEKSFNLFVKSKIKDGADKLLRLQHVMKLDAVTNVLADSMMIKDGKLFNLKDAKAADIRLPLGLTLVDCEGESVEVARNEEGIIWLYSKKENKLYKNNLKSITDYFSHVPEIELMGRLSGMLIQDGEYANASLLPIGGRALKPKEKLRYKSSPPKNPVMSSGRKLGNLVRHTKKKKERE